jgi:alpha-L-rhamnosidase
MQKTYHFPAGRQARWIGRPGTVLTAKSPVLPAPHFRKVFSYVGNANRVLAYFSGIGYGELYINGKKVGDHVLDPAPTHYDKRVRYVIHDITSYLTQGENSVGVILGNGWYNSHTPDAWNFMASAWRDYPKMLLQFEADGEVILFSDETWKVNSGPILFDGLRNGETYDARLELGDWSLLGYDDSQWQLCGRVAHPGGILQEQRMPACKVMETLPCREQWSPKENVTVFDFGKNISGWACVRMMGESGAKVNIRYGERLSPDRRVDQEHISMHIWPESRKVQTDCYILKGDGIETWAPRFTYHGFQYAEIECEGKVRVETIEAQVIHTAFESIGEFSCSDEAVNLLQHATRLSYKGNFVGIPTDCPHREKNGWTGDAHLACETGLYNFNAASSYNHWLDNFADIQRPSGQLPGIVPSCGWGFNWGSGPAWDSAYLLIPWYVYLYTGDRSAIDMHYEAMARYLDYCSEMATNGIVSFGLGDWCTVDRARMTNPSLTSTAYYYVDAKLMSTFAALTGRIAEQRRYADLALDIKKSFNATFYQGNGIYAKGEQTDLACALYQGLVCDAEKSKVVAQLVEAVNATGCKPDFGILGAKYVPRALADNGYVDLAYRLITQPDYPGWMHWINQGATTLWEDWHGKSSRNHIMFGDVSAWFYKYLGGIAPDPENPGFQHFLITPRPVASLEWVKTAHHIPQGKIISEWNQQNGTPEFRLEIPTGVSATVTLPNREPVLLQPGQYHLK